MNSDISERYYWAIHTSEFIPKSSDIFKVVLPNNIIYFFSEFIPNNSDTSERYYHTILHTFLRVHIKQFWHSDCRYKAILNTFSHSLCQAILTLSEKYYQTWHTFCQSSCKIILIFSQSYYQTILHISQNSYYIIHFQGVAIE